MSSSCSRLMVSRDVTVTFFCSVKVPFSLPRSSRALVLGAWARSAAAWAATSIICPTSHSLVRTTPETTVPLSSSSLAATFGCFNRVLAALSAALSVQVVDIAALYACRAFCPANMAQTNDSCLEFLRGPIVFILSRGKVSGQVN